MKITVTEKKEKSKTLERLGQQLLDEATKDIEKNKKIIKLSVNNKIVLQALMEGEDGDAYLLIKLLKDRYVYDHAAAEWLYWNDHFWRLDKINHVTVLVKEVIDLYGEQKIYETFSLQQAEEDGDEKVITRHKFYIRLLEQRIQSLRTLNRKKMILQLAASGLNSLGITGEQWDQHPMLFCCRNGCIDLSEGIFQAGQPGDYLKTSSPIKWEEHDTPCPAWEKFLLQMFSNDQEVVDYIQRLLGYGVTGLNTEHVFPIFWGHAGRNGKGTLFETLKYILGDFAYKTPSNFLMEQNFKSGGNSPDSVTMGLFGKRIVWCSETNEKDRLDVAKLKELVGGDTLTARLPYAKRQIEFTTTHLLLTITNRRPKIPANDQPLWNRIHLIPLTNSFVNNPNPNNPNEFQADKKLLAKLKQEASGILAWLIRGCLIWQEIGLKPPLSINAATEEYRENEDILGDFVRETCIVDDDKTLRVEPKILYEVYKNWCIEVGHHAMAKKRFLDDMKERFKMVKNRGYYYFIKIKLMEGGA